MKLVDDNAIESAFSMLLLLPAFAKPSGKLRKSAQRTRNASRKMIRNALRNASRLAHLLNAYKSYNLGYILQDRQYDSNTRVAEKLDQNQVIPH